MLYIHSEIVKCANKIRKEYSHMIPLIVKETNKIINNEGKCLNGTKCDFCFFNILFNTKEHGPTHNKVMYDLAIDKEVKIDNDERTRYKYKTAFLKEILDELEENQLEFDF